MSDEGIAARSRARRWAAETYPGDDQIDVGRRNAYEQGYMAAFDRDLEPEPGTMLRGNRRDGGFDLLYRMAVGPNDGPARWIGTGGTEVRDWPWVLRFYKSRSHLTETED